MRLALLYVLLVASPAAALPLVDLPCGAGGLACALENPGLEDPGPDGMPAGWSRYVDGPCDGLGVGGTASAARTGNAGVRVVDGPAQCTGFVSDPFPILPGLTYNGSLYVRAASGAPLVRIFVVWYANDGADLTAYLYKDGYQKAPTLEWQPLWSRTAAPPQALSARVWVYAPMASSGAFDVDDVAFVAS